MAANAAGVGPPTSRHLVINTFGPAVLIGHRLRVSNENPTENSLGSGTCEHLISVNQSRTIDIEIFRNAIVVIDVINGGAFVGQVRTNTNQELRIDNRVLLVQDRLSQRFTYDPPRYQPPTFRLELQNSQVIRRLDVRFWTYSWLTILMEGRNIMITALRGNELTDRIQTLLDIAVMRGARAQVTGNEPNTDFGINGRPMTREQRIRWTRRINEQTDQDRADPPNTENEERDASGRDNESITGEAQSQVSDTELDQQLPRLIPTSIRPSTPQRGTDARLETASAMSDQSDAFHSETDVVVTEEINQRLRRIWSPPETEWADDENQANSISLNVRHE